MVHLRSDLLTPALQRGDEVITVAASSALEDEQSLLEGLKVLEGWGLVLGIPTGQNGSQNPLPLTAQNLCMEHQ